ncbi:PLP-dependent aminotransferase family protein, partial [Priestia megaterium]
NKVEIIGQKAGLHLLVKVKNVSTKELINKAKKVGVRVYEPPSYYANEKIVEQSIVMIGFGGIPEEKIVEGIILLRKAWFSKTS